MHKLAIYEIEIHGHCGATEAERTIGQRLSIDVEMTCDLKEAVQSDRLEDTVDYDRLTLEIARIGRESRLHLIETLAEKIAETVLKNRRVQTVLVRVKKRLPPREEIRGGVVAEIVRRSTGETPSLIP